MDIEALRTFQILANTRNFTRTASQLYIAQSTVTNRINELEKELNVQLFNRTNRTVELTPEGEQFGEYAEKVIKLTNSSLTEISSLRKYEHQLRIGCADSIYEGHLAPVLLAYQKEHPKDALKITIGLTNFLMEQLEDDIYDVIFVYLPMKKNSFHCELFKQDRLVLVTDFNNDKYSEGITREELLGVNYLMCNFALQNVGQFIRNIFPRYHRFSMEIDDCSKVVPFLLGGQNYSFLPEDMAKSYIKSQKLRAVPLLDLETPVINSYIIAKNSKWEFCKRIFLE